MPEEQRAHSALGASVMERIFQCPGSYNLNQQLPPSPASSYAKEGTAAHTLASEHLLGTKDMYERLDETITVDGDEFTVTQEMIDAVEVYVNYIQEKAESAAKVLIEQRVAIPGNEHHEPLFGTADAILIRPFVEIEVVDYKHGAGKRVYVQDNKQVHYYALGAWLSMPDLDISTIRLTIVQPRCPGGGIDSYTITTEQLKEFQTALWATVETAAQDDAPLVPGDHCKDTFCPARARCPALQEHIEQNAGAGFAGLVLEERMLPAPLELTPAAISNLLTFAPLIEDRLKAVRDLALQMATHGQDVPGYKVVAKRANRKWADEERVNTLLGDFAYNLKIMTPAQVEKKLKAHNRESDISDLVIIPDNGVTLVPDSDKREAKTPFAGITVEV